MNSSTRYFRYNGDRTAYTSAAAAWGLLLLIESSLVALLIALLVPVGWLKILLLVLLLALNGWAIRFLRSPLCTVHTLTPDTLQLRYGASFAVDLPHAILVAAQPVQESLGGLAAIGARHDVESDRIVAVFSEKGQVLLSLAKPITVQLGPFRQATSHRLLINIDERDEFLAALNLPQTLPASPSSIPQTLQESIRAANSVEDLLQTEKVAPHWIGNGTGNGDVALCTHDLTRHFGDEVVVEGLDLSVKRGEIYGFLGPNGAGKTTTIKMLVGLLRPTAGRVIIDDHDVWVDPLAAKAAFGYVPDRSLLYERLTGVEYLQFLAQVRSLPSAAVDPEIERLLDLLGLTPHAGKLSGTYSFGMKRKLALAGALLHRPPVLILDEPLNGLDPRSARRLKDLFIELANEGKTIFLSTHDLHTAETVCHRVGIIHQGQLLVEGSGAELRTLADVPDLETVFLTLTAETLQEMQE